MSALEPATYPHRVYLLIAPRLQGTALRPSEWRGKTVVRWDDERAEDHVWTIDIGDAS